MFTKIFLFRCFVRKMSNLSTEKKCKLHLIIMKKKDRKQIPITFSQKAFNFYQKYPNSNERNKL